MNSINDIKIIQKIQFQILTYFHEVCINNDLTYFLAYGTLLGAVRHSGFIPWDDDIDVMMPRSDYLKFIDIINNDKHPYYKFISMHTNKKYFAPIAKIFDDRTILIQQYGQVEKTEIGVYIDIFIIDGLPEGKNKHHKIIKRIQFLKFIWSLSIRRFDAKSKTIVISVIKTIISLPFRILGHRLFLLMLDNYCSKYSCDSSEYVAVLCFGEGKKEIIKKNDLLPSNTLTFEGKEFSCPCNHHQYLIQMYGDYMTLPPKNGRKIHKNSIYSKDEDLFKNL